MIDQDAAMGEAVRVEKSMVDRNMDEVAGTHELLDQAEIQRRISGLASVESRYAACDSYINTIQKNGMTIEWRTKIIIWYHQLGDSYHLHWSTLYAAINFLDRFLSFKSCDSMNFRLAAIGCLFLACKLEERHPICHKTFCMLSEYIFNPCEIRLIELELLKTLRWHLCPITPIAFADLLAMLIPEEEEENEDKNNKNQAIHLSVSSFQKKRNQAILQATRQLLSDTLYDFEYLKFSPSMRAVTALSCMMKEHQVPTDQVHQWFDIVKACGFDYYESPDAAVLMQECLALLYARIHTDKNDDYEVQCALHQNNSTPGNNTPHQDTHANRTLASPNDISKIDSVLQAQDYNSTADAKQDDPSQFNFNNYEPVSIAEEARPSLERADSTATVTAPPSDRDPKRCRFISS